MKARDIMEPVKDTLSPDETLRDAVNKMKSAWRGENRFGVKGMNVVDSEGNLVGMVSIKDVIAAIIPSYMDLTEVGGFTWDGMLEEMTKRVANRKVTEIMTKDVKTVTEDSPLMECANFLITQNLQRLPVVNEDKKVVGMIYVRDIYYAMTKVLH